jgi:hypothetical protein
MLSCKKSEFIPVLNYVYIIKHDVIKACGSGGTAPVFFTSALDRGEWSVPLPSHFTPRERILHTR